MARIVIYHSYYGCDTGCCGHTVELTEDDGTEKEEFTFSHPPYVPNKEDPLDVIKAWARTLIEETFGKEHVEDLDWDNCVLVDD